MKSSHKKKYVWLQRGSRGVIGFKVEELNDKIDEWNNYPCPIVDFWEWLSFVYDDVLTGFDYLWNQGNPQMGYVHIIKKKVI